MSLLHSSKNMSWKLLLPPYFMYVCMYVFYFISQAQDVSQTPFYESYITISQSYSTNKCEFSSSSGIIEVWYLDMHPNCSFWAVVLRGERTIFCYLCLRKERPLKVIDSVSHPPGLLINFLKITTVQSSGLSLMFPLLWPFPHCKNK